MYFYRWLNKENYKNRNKLENQICKDLSICREK